MGVVCLEEFFLCLEKPLPGRRAGKREKWIIQGHIGSTWQKGQYVRTRDLAQVKPAFEDLLQRLGSR